MTLLGVRVGTGASCRQFPGGGREGPRLGAPLPQFQQLGFNRRVPGDKEKAGRGGLRSAPCSTAPNARNDFKTFGKESCLPARDRDTPRCWVPFPPHPVGVGGVPGVGNGEARTIPWCPGPSPIWSANQGPHSWGVRAERRHSQPLACVPHSPRSAQSLRRWPGRLPA